MKKWMLLAALAVGYVLGAKAGRERYEQLRRRYESVRNNPTVQSAAATVADTAREQAPVVKDKIVGAGAAAVAKVRHSDDEATDGAADDLVEQLHPESTARQDDPYPQGDLP